MLNPFQEMNSNWNKSRQNSVELDFLITATIYGLIWVYFFARQEKKNSMLQLWNVLPLCMSMKFVVLKQHFKKNLRSTFLELTLMYTSPLAKLSRSSSQVACHGSDKVNMPA